MIYIMKNGGHDTYNIKQFTLDTPDDLPNLPTSGIAVGSAALVISTSDVYMLNSKGEWDLIASDAEGILPSYSVEDVGKILEVGEGGILAWAANNALPSVTSEDEGKVLKVDDQGEWVAAIDSNTQYTAGTNIQISEENVISATDTTYTAGSGIEISEQNVISNTAEGNTDIIAEEYDSTKAYAVGDYCIYDNKLYRCISAITESKWHKVPCDWYNPSSTWSRSYTSEDECYMCLNAETNYWGIIFASKTQTAIINWTGAGGYGSYSLNQTYSGGAENIYYRGEYGNMYANTTLDGSSAHYTSEASALADLDRTFNVSNWTEVTVGDELKSIKEDSSTVNITTEESLAGFKYNGKDVYVKEVVFNNVAQNTSYSQHIGAVNIVKFDGYATDASSGKWFYNINDYGPGYDRAFDPDTLSVHGPDGRSNATVHVFVYYTKID